MMNEKVIWDMISGVGAGQEEERLEEYDGL